MRKLVLLFGAILFIVLGAFVIDRVYRTQSTSTDKISIVATFYPHGAFAQAVGENHVEITILVPPGSEPHDFEPTPQQITRLTKARLFIYNGAGLEKWVDKLLPILKKNNVVTIDASKGLDLIKIDDKHVDPHYWLDPIYAYSEVSSIALSLSDIDPAHKGDYSVNSEKYKAKLLSLDKEIREGLHYCTRYTVITSHEAFAYYAHEYSFNATSIAGLSPEEEPSPARLAQIAQQARSQNIKFIFFESLVSPRLSDTIAKEIGAQTLVFNPLEGLTQDEIKSGKDYITVQRDNLQNLKIALECK